VLHVDLVLDGVSIGLVGMQFMLGAFAVTGFPRDAAPPRGGPRRAAGAGEGAGAGAVTYVGQTRGAAGGEGVAGTRPRFVVGGGR